MVLKLPKVELPVNIWVSGVATPEGVHQVDRVWRGDTGEALWERSSPEDPNPDILEIWRNQPTPKALTEVFE